MILKTMVGIGSISFSYRQHETPDFFIPSLVWGRGKMKLCDDKASHQTISQN